jgi:hypothetical protein
MVASQASREATAARKAKLRARRKERKTAKRAAEKAEQRAAIERYAAVQAELAALAAAHPDEGLDQRSYCKPDPKAVSGAPRRDGSYGGESVRTVSGGLPTLGRGR